MSLSPDLLPPGDIALARSGDAGALTRLYAAHGGDMLRIAYRLTGDRHDAEDIVQDVFVGLPEALRRYEDRGALGAWLGRVTARVALMHRRRTSRRGEEPIDHALVGGDRADALAAGTIAARALAALPDDLRVVFVLRELEGFTHAEIAALLGIRRGTSEVRLFRAIRRLRTILRNDR